MSNERDVAVEYFETRKESLRGEVVEKYSSMAADIIRKKYFNADNFDDLMQESALAILKALDKFDPSKGSFSTLAHFAINRNIIMYLKKNCIFGNYRNKRERVVDSVLEFIPYDKPCQSDLIDTVNQIFSRMDKDDVSVLKKKFGITSGKPTHYASTNALRKFKNIAVSWGLKSSDFHRPSHNPISSFSKTV